MSGSHVGEETGLFGSDLTAEHSADIPGNVQEHNLSVVGPPHV